MEFRLSDALGAKTVELDQHAFKDKQALFDHMATMLLDAEKIDSKELFIEALNEREATGSTFMDNAIAIPHGKGACVKQAAIAFLRTKTPFLYESCGESGMAQLIFMLAIPEGTETKDYLSILATLSRLLVYEEFVEALLAAKSYDEIIAAAKEAEQRRLNLSS